MPIDKKLIRFKTKANFLSQANGVNNKPSEPTSGSEADGTAVYGNLRGSSIVFIEDSKEIWTHGNLYKSANWSVLKLSVNLITFTIESIPYQAEEGMTWGEWVNSKYNVDKYYWKNGDLRSPSSGVLNVCDASLQSISATDIIGIQHLGELSNRNDYYFD